MRELELLANSLSQKTSLKSAIDIPVWRAPLRPGRHGLLDGAQDLGVVHLVPRLLLHRGPSLAPSLVCCNKTNHEQPINKTTSFMSIAYNLLALLRLCSLTFRLTNQHPPFLATHCSPSYLLVWRTYFYQTKTSLKLFLPKQLITIIFL